MSEGSQPYFPEYSRWISSGLVALGPTEFSAKQNTAWRLSLKPWREHGQRLLLQVAVHGGGRTGQSLPPPWTNRKSPREQRADSPAVLAAPHLGSLASSIRAQQCRNEPGSGAGLPALILAQPLTRGTSQAASSAPASCPQNVVSNQYLPLHKPSELGTAAQSKSHTHRCTGVGENLPHRNLGVKLVF